MILRCGILPALAASRPFAPVQPAPIRPGAGKSRRAESGQSGEIPLVRFARPAGALSLQDMEREVQMKGIIAWFMGVPLVVIILLYAFGYF